MRVSKRWAAIVSAAFGLGALGCPPPPAAQGGGARFEIYSLQTNEGPTVFRFDTATGALERAPLVGARSWLALGEPAAASGAPGRFDVDFAQAASIPLTFVRLDTQTGAAWRLAYPRDRAWVAFRDAGSEGESGSEHGAAAPSPRPAPVAERRLAPALAAPAGSRIGGPNASVARGEDFSPFIDTLAKDTIPVEMKAWAVEQLGLVDNTEAVGPLIEALDLPETAIVRSAIRSLAHYPQDARVRPALERMAKSDQPEVARVAQSALAKLP